MQCQLCHQCVVIRYSRTNVYRTCMYMYTVELYLDGAIEDSSGAGDSHHGTRLEAGRSFSARACIGDSA